MTAHAESNIPAQSGQGPELTFIETAKAQRRLPSETK